MREIILAAALSVLAGPVLAQYPYPPPRPPGMHTGSPSSMSNRSIQPDPNNCGTPDEPKPCPPMPRRALDYYPENRHP